MEYYCAACKNQMEEPICPIHKTPNQPAGMEVAEDWDETEEEEEKEDFEAGGFEEKAREAPSVHSAVPPQPPQRPAAPTASTQKRTVDPASVRLLEEYHKENYEVFLIAGIQGAGKTEMLDAYKQDGYLKRVKRRAGMAMPTAQVKFDCHPVGVKGRKVVFVDASGEDFRLLYPKQQQTGEIDESDIRFLSLATQRLGGLVLLIELGQLWRAEAYAESVEAEQVEILTWVLSQCAG